jgi:trk system potassium uptake protein TrkH
MALWKIYLAMTIVLYLALRITGMDPFDAACHTFSTLGTGGFSTRTASIAEFRSPAIELVLITFMLLAGINFTLHYRLWVERRAGVFLRDPEFRAYTTTVLLATAAITWSLLDQGGLERWTALRAALFQVAAIITTTGFVTADFELWRPLPQLLLLALMFCGGCTGSTSGGLKVSRLVLLGKVIGREFQRMVERRGVFAIRLGGQPVPEPSIQAVLNLVYLALVVNFTACLALAAMGLDVLTSISAVATSMFNVGPGLGQVGPTDHYGGLPAPAKWVLSFCMLAGRLEFYTLMVVFAPAYWRK